VFLKNGLAISRRRFLCLSGPFAKSEFQIIYEDHATLWWLFGLILISRKEVGHG
jgi:hypothetical protein